MPARPLHTRCMSQHTRPAHAEHTRPKHTVHAHALRNAKLRAPPPAPFCITTEGTAAKRPHLNTAVLAMFSTPLL